MEDTSYLKGTIKKNKSDNKRMVLLSILTLFILCSIPEYIEFLIIKTDQTFLAENVLCKLFIIAVVLAVHDVVRTMRMIFCEVKHPENGGAGRIERR